MFVYFDEVELYSEESMSEATVFCAYQYIAGGLHVPATVGSEECCTASIRLMEAVHIIQCIWCTMSSLQGLVIPLACFYCHCTGVLYSF